MGIWLRAPRLDKSEQIRWEQLANRTQSQNRAVGGKLYLTPARLLFEPNHFDGLTGGHSWHAPLREISAVGVQDADGRMFNGGLRKRLRLHLADGSVELFVVNKVDEAVRTIELAVRGA
ncbi:hypothetical protein AB0H76_38025 [Nocardia sp. NPDC050712]|uniref:hypothetical protein n=1 Tax=Nocardia sp. NPDC050712 TaxID=3155518 RepID=UPI0033C96473